MWGHSMAEAVLERAVFGVAVEKWPPQATFFRTPWRIGLALLFFLTHSDAEQRVRPPVPVLRPTITVLGEASDVPGPVDLALDNVALSPNGRLITYTTYNDLRIRDTLTHEEAIILTGPVHVAEWGSKGDVLVFQTHAGPLTYQGKELSRDPAIWTIRLDSITGRVLEPPRLVAQVPVNHAAVFSPDQQMIALVQWHGWYVSSLAVVPAMGGVPRILAGGVEVAHYEWNSDGSALYYSAFESSSSTNPTRYRVPLAGGAPVPIKQDRPMPPGVPDNVWRVTDRSTGEISAYMEIPAGVDVTDWNGLGAWPGRNEIAGVRYSRPRRLRVVRLADGNIRDLSDPATEVVSTPEWFADDRVTFIIRQGAKLALQIQQVDGSNPRTIPLSNDSVGHQLQISPDGRYAAFVGQSLRFQSIELVDLAVGQRKALVKIPADHGNGNAPEGRTIGAFAWSDNSASILYVSDVWTAAPAIHQVTLSGADKTLRPLPTFIYGPTLVSFPSTKHQDFVELAGARNEKGGGAVVLVPIGVGPPRVVLSEVASAGPMSPDGHTLALPIAPANGQGAQIRLAATDRSSTRNLVLSFLALPVMSQWHPDGQQLFMLGRQKSGFEQEVSIYSVPINGNPPSVVANVGTTRGGAALAVSPSGKFIAVTTAAAARATFLKLQYDTSKVSQTRRQ
jgi:hypothetical protein